MYNGRKKVNEDKTRGKCVSNALGRYKDDVLVNVCCLMHGRCVVNASEAIGC